MTRTAAVAYSRPGPPEVLEDVEIEVPDPRPHDLLVEIRAVSVNPADVKSRAGNDPGGAPKVLGYDAAGVVLAIGEEVTCFEVGDEVFYAGPSIVKALSPVFSWLTSTSSATSPSR